MLPVLIVSQDSRFLDCVGNALEREGMWAVSVKNAAREVAKRGFRARAIVVDPAALLESRGAELARYLCSYSILTTAPVFSISSAAKRVELVELLGELHRLQA
jgi:hypothetical protein